MRLLLVSLMTLVLPALSGCLMTPGMREPRFSVYTIITSQEASCDTTEGAQCPDLPVPQMIGFQCVSPAAYADAQTHHNVLHRELNRRLK